MKEVKIETIKIKIGKREVELTIEEAKKMKELLNDLFGKEIVKEITKEEHHYHDYYSRPYYWTNTVRPSYPNWEVLCDSSNDRPALLAEYKASVL